MGVNWRTTVLFALLLLTLAGTSLAQAVTGSVRGTVKDAEGAVMPGVTVTAVSDALVAGRMMALTDASGVYRFPSLPIGTYTIEAELSGFNPARRAGVRVSIGTALALDLTMSLATMTESISVTAEAPVLSTVANNVATSFDTEYIETAPVARNFYRLLAAAPGVNASSTSGTSSNMLAYGGTSDDQNAFTMDGVNVASTGGGDHWLLPSIQWMEEIQIGGLGAAAEYGGYTGGVINGVTKSGGNEFSGGFEYYYQPASWVSDNTPESDDDELKFTNISASVGGRLIKDKLWFFLAGEMWNEVTTPLGAAGTSDREIPRYLGKLTYQHNDANRFSVMAEYDKVTHDRRGISEYTWAEASSKQYGPNFTMMLDWESLINAENFASVRLTGYDGRDDSLPYNGFDTPAHVDYYNTEITWANQEISELNHRSLKNLDASWNLYKDGLFSDKDSHTFKFGGHYEIGKSSEEWRRNGGFTYYDDSSECDSWEAYMADPLCGAYFIEYGWGEYSVDAEFTGMAFYAQDSIRFNRLTVNAGLRYGAYDGGFSEGYGDSSVYDVSFIDPRIGFVYDLRGDARSAVKAHYGRYHNKMFAYLYDREASGEAAIPDMDCYWDSDTGDFTDCDDPAAIRARMGETDHPYVDEILLSFEQQIGRSILVGIDFADRQFKSNMAMINANNDYELITAEGNPITGGTLPIWNLLSEQDWVLTSDNDGYRDFQSVTARFDKRHADKWSLRASVVWTDMTGNMTKNNSYAYDWWDRNGQTNGDGRIDFSYNEWEGKLSGAYDLPFNFQASALYTYLSGWYWTPYVRISGLDYNSRTGRDIYLTERGSEKLDARNLVDFRLAWNAKLPQGMALTAGIEVFNVFNSDTVVDLYNRWGTYRISRETWTQTSSYGTPYMIERPREIRAGIRLMF
ncbi:MAG: TonB-dependent receptor [Thermoanaerobaculia bacterium]